ncbi:protein CURLY FLAG LEAF 1-like [Lycium barbarum]|uniref:protein CURLY FLAG LEAF 1-like n=1 Tax=Lycium barbarum TaxID=112863 RepID=UPI00293F5601|nr:protein CURLY FLAG LEAF 1-like [Lycium barbarum]
MISLQTSLSQDLSKKRKWEEISEKPQQELQLETPLPLEWQRCLDIKSGHIYFHNTRTQERTSRDPRLSPDLPPTPDHISLDLQLNLPCGSLENNQLGDYFTKNDSVARSSYYSKRSGEMDLGFTRSPSWLTFDGDDQREMFTAVCKKCHMLVMMCKSSPACPNCKFINPTPDQRSPNTLFKRKLSLSCRA